VAVTNNQHAARLREMAEQVPSMGQRTRAALLAGAEALENLQVAKAALRGLVAALEQVHEDPYYQRVWNVHQMHCGPYKGKKYEAELKQATAVLARLEGK
jgi:hypothetical protein